MENEKKRFFCYHEEPKKNIYLQVRPYEQPGEVKLSISAYQGEKNLIEVCLTESQINGLIEELTRYKNGC